MSIIRYILILLFFIPSVCFSTDYYITNSGAGSQNGSNCANAHSLSWFNSNGDDDDRALLCAGTFTTQINPTNSGSEGHPITYIRDPAANEWDVVITNSTSYCVSLAESDDWIVVDGLYFNGCESSWIRLNGSDYGTFQNNRFYSADAYSGIVVGDYINDYSSDDNTIQNNTFDNAPIQDSVGSGRYWDAECQTQWEAQQDLNEDCNNDTMPADAVRIDRGSRNRVIGNTFGWMSHDAINISPYDACPYTIVRGNTSVNEIHRFLDVNDNTLVEDNIVKASGSLKLKNPTQSARIGTVDGGAISVFGPKGSAPPSIIRNNLTRDNDCSFYIGAKSVGSSTNNLFYNNTSYNDFSVKFVGNNYATGYTGNTFTNNIIYHDGNYVARTILIPHFPSSSPVSVYNITDAGTVTNYFIGNMWTTNEDTFYFKNQYTNARSLSYVETNYPTEWFSNNFAGSPSFTNIDGDDFTLQSDSDAIDSGQWLTTITSATGSGSSITVNNPYYFFDGWGISGETGDIIKTELGGQTATIVSISGSVLNLNQSISWTNGEGISLDYEGDAPDVGAEEYAYTGITITLVATDNSGSETGPDTITFTFYCSPNCSSTNINYSFNFVDAVLDSDYNCDDEDGIITITGASDTIVCTPVDDSEEESTEYMGISLQSGDGYTIGSPYFDTAIILDNDTKPQGKALLSPDGSGTGKINYNNSGTGKYNR